MTLVVSAPFNWKNDNDVDDGGDDDDEDDDDDDDDDGSWDNFYSTAGKGNRLTVGCSGMQPNI